MRIYLDGANTPAIQEHLRYFLGGGAETEQEHRFNEKRMPDYLPNESSFLGGFGTIPYPMAGVQSLGCILYLPIPYSKHCKITYDRPGKCYNRIDCRTYQAGTAVKTFTLAALKTTTPVIRQAAQSLLQPEAPKITKQLPAQTRSLEPSGTLVTELGEGPKAPDST